LRSSSTSNCLSISSYNKGRAEIIVMRFGS
jgi:hypothetical protein